MEETDNNFTEHKERVEKEMTELIDKAIKIKADFIIEFIQLVPLEEVDKIYDLVIKGFSKRRTDEIRNLEPEQIPF